MGVVSEETGIISSRKDAWVESNVKGIGGIFYVGHLGNCDTYTNGYISFNITDLAGVKVVSVTLTMDLDEECGDRSPLGYLRIGTLDYGTGPLSLSDGDIPAKLLVQLPNSTTDVSYSSHELAEELQKNIDAASDRFQLKVYWSHPHSDEDGIADRLSYLKEDISLTVQYTE